MSSSRAQTVGVDLTGWGPMDGFELYGNGIYWWNDGSIPNELTPARTGQVAIRSLIAGSGLVTSSSRPHFVAQSIELRARYQSAARNDDWMVYFSGPNGSIRIQKKGNYGPNPILNDFSGSFFREAGAILMVGPTVYFAARGGHASDNGEVRTKDINGPPGGGDVILKQGMGLVTKMKVVPLVEESGAIFNYYVILLNTLGQVWHIRLPGLFDPTTGPLTLYASDVADFDWRAESELVFQGGFLRRVHGTRLYFASGVTTGTGRPTGKLSSWNFTSGGITTEYDSGSPNLQVTGVTVDSERLFITQTPLIETAPGVFNWNLPNSVLMRKDAPTTRGIVFNNFGVIATQVEGRNLRSDTNWLYFAHLNEIRKIKTDSPDLQLDYRAVGLEAVQAVQDFNNSVPLIAGKSTLVRGYAQVVVNTTSRSKYRMTARLRAFRNGAQLPGEVDAYSNPINLLAGDLPTLRANWDRAFLFETPLNWIEQAGPMQLQMTINPDGAVPEIGSGAFANNSASITVNVAPARVPCLVFKPMSSPMGNYDPNAPGSGFWDIVDRATSLLPVSGFKVHFSKGSVRKPVFPFDAEAFSMPGDQYWALTWMTLAHAFTRDPNGCADTHWVGMFPPNIGTWSGLAGARGVSLRDVVPDSEINITLPRTALDNTSIVRMDPGRGNSSNPWSTVGGGETLAHELGHNYGRLHIDQTRSGPGCGGSRPLFPYHFLPPGIDPCTLGIIDLNNFAAPIGYDVRTDTLIRPDAAGDLMTYANSSWISPFTWNALVGAIPAHVPPGFRAASEGMSVMLNPQPLPPGGIVLAQGIINPASRNATLMPSFQLPNGILDDGKIQESLGAISLPLSMPYKLRLLDAGGSVLDERAIVPLVPSEMVDGQFAFVQAVPNLPGANRVQVLQGSTVLNESRASLNAPTITLMAPSVNVDSETLSLQWTASDADNDPLLFSVQFSPDNGVSWESLSVHDPVPGLTVGTRQLRGGTACRLRVIATDGFQTAMATTAPFNVPKHSPILTINGIRNQQQLPFNSNVLVRVFAYDAEDGSIESEAISWAITGPVSRSGRGGRFPITGLAPGNYTLSASAPDLDGTTGLSTLGFTVRPMEVLDGSLPQVDGILDEVYPDSTEIRLYPNRAAPSARLLHAGGSLYVCFDGLPYADPESSPADINFYVDGDGIATSAPQANDVGFGVTEDGVPARASGTGAGWTAENPQGFEVKILRAALSWSAEFRVPDSLIGGWNHASAITVSHGRGFGSPVVWPPSANVFNPSTWSALSLGPLPNVTNRPPVAVASAPSVVEFTGIETVALDGLGSYDLDGDPLTFSWTQTGGASVILANANTPAPSFQTPSMTSSAFVTFQLIVNDGVRSSTPQQVTVLLAPGRVPPSTATSQPPVTINVGNGSARIRLNWPGPPGSLAVIQASSNLVNWANLATNSASFLGTLLHMDLQAGQHPRRFYRAVEWDQPEQPLSPAQLSFDGADDFVQVPHSPALNSLPLTVTAWFRTSVAAPIVTLVGKEHWTDNTGYRIALNQGYLSCYISAGDFRFIFDDGPSSGMPFVADGHWHHVAWVVDSSGGRVYLDGSLVRSAPWFGEPGPPITIQPLRFGYFPEFLGPRFYQGDLDEVTVWNRALTADEINQRIPGQLSGTEVGLQGCWKFNDGTGTVATDSSPAGRHGTLFNGTEWTRSTAPLLPNLAAGTTLRFDGTNQSVVVAHHGSLNAFPLTISAWVKTAQKSPGYVAIANRYSAGSGNGYSVHIHNGRIAAFYFRGNGNSWVYPGDPGLDGGFIADGKWHHVAFTVDAGGGRIFVDGVQTGSLGWTGTPGGCSTTVPLSFGQYPLGGQVLSLDGRIDELTLWNRALNATEINAVMNVKQTGSEPDLLGYWPFDDAAGTTAIDATGHGHNGILQNGPLWLPSDAPFSQ